MSDIDIQMMPLRLSQLDAVLNARYYIRLMDLALMDIVSHPMVLF